MSTAVERLRRRRRALVRDLAALVRIPTVSAGEAHAADVRRGAAWLADRLGAAGLHAEVVPGDRHPSVLGWGPEVVGRPTVVLYAHYDVQPAGGRETWSRDPFAPSVRGDRLWGRGAADDKGPLVAVVHALESLRRSGGLPVNVRILFDGEEEIGSPSRASLVRRLGRADVAVVADTKMLGVGRPTLTVGLRGVLVVRVVASGAARALHSGTYGGAVADPPLALARLLAGLHDADGRIAVAGVYDRVRRRPPGPEAAASRALLASAGVAVGVGEAGFSAVERASVRPALVVTGLRLGADGAGSPSAIAPRAEATLTFRLVPDQAPARVLRLLRAHVSRWRSPGVRFSVEAMAEAPPVDVPSDGPAVRAAVGALRETFGRPPALVRSGGTIPGVATLQEEAGATPLLLGMSQPDDGVHGPNESAHLPTLFAGSEAVVRLLVALGRLRPRRRTSRATSRRGAARPGS